MPKENKPPSSAWLEEVVYVLFLLIALGLVGSIFSLSAWFVLAGGMGYLAWNLYNLFLIERWIRLGDRVDPPDATGIWEVIFKSYYQLQKRQKKDQRRKSLLIKRFRSTARAMPDPAFILASDLSIEWLNAAASSAFGMDVKNDVGVRVDNIFRGEEFRSWISSGGYDESLDYQPPGSGRIYSFRLAPFEAKGGLLMIAIDVTDSRRLERFRRDFVANASHELRTPITVFSGYLEQLEQEEIDPQSRVARSITAMRGQAIRMRQLVEDMLSLARLEDEESVSSNVVVNVPSLLIQAKADFSVLAQDRNQSVSYSIDQGLGIEGIEDAVRVVVTNLLSNAIRYSDEGGQIEVAWRKDGQGRPVFSVADHGPGIAKEHIDRLTERFYRIDAGRSRGHGGTGLGLSIVKHAMERHDGVLSIESVVGKGSVFQAKFPERRAVGLR